MRDIFISTKFMSDDGMSFLVDTLNRVWVVRRLFDEDFVEVDTVTEAVTAEVTCSKYMLCGIADLTDMNTPRIN